MINSTSNKQIKNLIQLQAKSKVRKEQGLFVTEGIKMYREVPERRLIKTYVSESFYNKEENRKLLEGISERNLEIVADHVFEAAADTKTPQGILCLVKQEEYVLDDILNDKKPLLLLLEDIQDPGNLGTIFRTAEGAGITGIIMSSKTADIYNPKTIRSTMGSLYRMPFLQVKEFEPVLDELKKREIRTYAAHLQGSVDYTAEDYTGGSAFMIGNEGNGLSEKLASQADVYIKIPMSGQLESLNAAIAAAILMFEARRQRG
ncbi:MAG: RNA methyltransferase [Eubacteriales bacterium]|nr:RNA methyltransferase [Eubacteriales bacterium]